MSFEDGVGLLRERFTYQDVFDDLLKLVPAEARVAFAMIDAVFEGGSWSTDSVLMIPRRLDRYLFVRHIFWHLDRAEIVTWQVTGQQPFVIDFALSPDGSSRPTMPRLATYLGLFATSMR